MPALVRPVVRRSQEGFSIMSSLARSSAVALSVALAVPLQLATPVPAAAAGGFKKRVVQLAVCVAVAKVGVDLGEKLAEIEVRKRNLSGEEARKHKRAIQVGMAAALCGTSFLLTNTIYNKLGERDRKAREREMDAALADASSGTRSYVLPESGYEGQITTELVEDEGKRECRSVVDVLSKEGEPARARYCRTKPDGKYDLDL